MPIISKEGLQDILQSEEIIKKIGFEPEIVYQKGFSAASKFCEMKVTFPNYPSNIPLYQQMLIHQFLIDKYAPEGFLVKFAFDDSPVNSLVQQDRLYLSNLLEHAYKAVYLAKFQEGHELRCLFHQNRLKQRLSQGVVSVPSRTGFYILSEFSTDNIDRLPLFLFKSCQKSEQSGEKILKEDIEWARATGSSKEVISELENELEYLEGGASGSFESVFMEFKTTLDPSLDNIPNIGDSGDYLVNLLGLAAEIGLEGVYKTASLNEYHALTNIHKGLQLVNIRKPEISRVACLK